MPKVKQGSSPFHALWSMSGEADRLVLIDFFLRDLQEVYESESRAGCHPVRRSTMLWPS